MSVITRKIALAGALALGLGGAAQASTMNFDYQGPGAFGSPNLSQTVRIQSTDYNGWVRAGAFRMTSGETGDFVAWCIDLAQHLGSGRPYQEAPNLLSQAAQTGLGRLFGSVYHQIDTGLEAAAFQLAIWEIIDEDAANDYDLAAGDFSASRNSGAIGLAQTYLDGLLGADDHAGLRYFESGSSQDLVTADLAPVPLPASGALIVMGLGGLALVRRRRRRQA
ncbi:MAG: VPLPA-CTERM sorting domain-containing protein [Pseudomonadota bacterium]